MTITLQEPELCSPHSVLHHSGDHDQLETVITFEKGPVSFSDEAPPCSSLGRYLRTASPVYT